MPVPCGISGTTPFLTSLGASLGLYPDLIYGGVDPSLVGSPLFAYPTTTPFFAFTGGFLSGGSKTDETLHVVPNPFGDETLPTIFVGGVPDSFGQKNIFEKYLQGFKYLSWPEQMKMYQVAGGAGRTILASTGICPDFSKFGPMLLVS